MYFVDETSKKKACELFGQTQKTAQENINEIRKWMEDDSKIPEVMSDAKIRNMLNLCKYKVSKTKEKIKLYYNAKKKYPEVFKDCNPKMQHMKDIMEQTHFAHHPVLEEGLYRILFVKPKTPDLNPENICKLFFSIHEIRLEEDLMFSDILVLDSKNVNLWTVTKLSPLMIYKSFTAYTSIYAFRTKELHFINSPSYLSVIIKVLKLIMKPKIFERIKVHSDEEILKERFPIDVLPKDYGGNGFSLDELDEMMKKKIQEYQQRFDYLDEIRS